MSRDISPFLIFPRGRPLSTVPVFGAKIRFEYRHAIKGTLVHETGKQGVRLVVYRSKPGTGGTGTGWTLRQFDNPRLTGVFGFQEREEGNFSKCFLEKTT